MTFASKWCYGDFDVAASSSQCSRGAALRLIVGRDCWNWLVTARLDAQQKGYLFQTQDCLSERVKVSQKYQLSRHLPNNLGYLTLSYINARRWKASSTRKLEALWEVLMWHSWRLQLTASHAYQDHEYKNEARVVLTYHHMGETVNRTHIVRYGKDLQSLRTTLSNHPQRDQRLSWKATHYRDYHRGDKPADTLNTSIRHKSDHLDAYYAGWIDEIGGENKLQHNLNLGFSLCYADGCFGVGRPINDCFALVAVDEEFKDLNVDVIALNKQRWTANSKLSAVIPGLVSYRPTNIHVAAESTGVDWNQTSFIVKPRYRGAAIIRLKIQDDHLGAFVVTGILKDQQGKPLSLKAILIKNAAFPDHEPHFTFTNEEGFFRATGMQIGAEYTFEVLDNPKMQYQLTVPTPESYQQSISVSPELNE